MRGRFLAGGALALANTLIVGVLTAAQTSETFEVASIKPAASIERGGGSAGLQPGGRLVVTNGPARVLINMAYRTVTGEIIGAPDWVTYENYDVEARAGRDLTYEQLPPLLRNLLADRFRLKTHFETHTRPMYELHVVRADGVLGPAMRPSKANCDSSPASCIPRGGTGLIESGSMAMNEFVTWLPGLLGRQVIDKTGLAERYELLLKYSPTDSDDLPSLPTALREQLGLRLEPIQAATDILVIDHIERPTPN